MRLPQNPCVLSKPLFVRPRSAATISATSYARVVVGVNNLLFGLLGSQQGFNLRWAGSAGQFGPRWCLYRNDYRFPASLRPATEYHPIQVRMPPVQ